MANSWTSAENNVITYLISQLGDTLNTTAFAGEFPDSFADETLDYMWYFAIPGGGEPDSVGGNYDYCGLNGAAIFEGVFESREKAQEYGISVKNLLPFSSGTVSNIYDLRLESEPSIERAIIRRNPDQDNAGELRVWRLRIPMEAVVTA